MGRHRKPTNSSISVAKIAVTGAVIGGSGIGMAAQAQAATDAEWDTVARCESSGNWAINTGNGYHGGLQFAPSTWLGYGGGQFASVAHQATREQQIAIAEKVLAGQGKGAWPTCGRGLSGPSPRNVLPAAPADADSAPTDAAPATPLDAPADAAPTTPLDTPADAAPATPLDAPAPEAPAPAQDAPAELPAPPAELPAPPADTPAIISIGNDAAAPAEIVPAAAATPLPEQAPESIVVDAAWTAPAPLTPADPAMPPADPTAVPPVPADPAAPADPAGAPAAVASDQVGVPHLPSPDNPPPGTSDDPLGQTESANVSYLKDLWHALQNEEITRSDLILALAQRNFNTPVPNDVPAMPPAEGTAPAAVPAPAPAPVPDPVPVTP